MEFSTPGALQLLVVGGLLCASVVRLISVLRRRGVGDPRYGFLGTAAVNPKSPALLKFALALLFTAVFATVAACSFVVAVLAPEFRCHLVLVLVTLVVLSLKFYLQVVPPRTGGGDV